MDSLNENDPKNETTENDNLEKKLICIEYPGLVKNIKNMKETLGGSAKISEIFCNEKRRLEIKFHPKNLYCKSVFGDRTSTTGLLLKIKNSKHSDQTLESEHSISVLGKVDTCYRFNSLYDFQILPISKTSHCSKAEFIYNELVPQSIEPHSWITEPSNTPYFLPPVSFSRIDSVQTRLFKGTINEDKTGNNDNIIGCSRKRRTKYGTYVPFSLTEPVPMKRNPAALSILKVKFITDEQYNTIQELFEKRPIWTKTALSYVTKISVQQLKIILPSIAYYFTTGPWRILWVRFGYDPRKHFDSRHYQTLDYRVRNQIGIKNYVKIKRGYTIHKPNFTQKSRNNVVINAQKNEQKNDEILYSPYFEIGKFPESRQMFYQYCDIRVPKIQEMLDKLPSPMSGAVCNEKTGWLPSGFEDQCRDILTDLIREHFKNELMKKEELDNDIEDEGDLSDFDEENEINLEEQLDDMDIDEESQPSVSGTNTFFKS